MLEETLLHKGSAEEWNSVMINEHLPGKPLQHNLDFPILGLYRAKNACMHRGSRVEGGGDNNAFHDTSTSHSHLHILLAANRAATAYISYYTINHTSKMNSLNALGNRQISSLQADLAKMETGESGPSVQG